MRPPQPLLPLFSYGTLQQPEVQLATWGRLVDGCPDMLRGYRLAPLEIMSPEVVAVSGKAIHMIACRTGDADDLVRGVLFRITAAELEAADAYEEDDYARCRVRLLSGVEAFVYVRPDG